MTDVEATDMESLPEILNAFEQALELERELGTRTVECDRALLSLPMAAREPMRLRGSAALPTGTTDVSPVVTRAAPPTGTTGV